MSMPQIPQLRGTLDDESIGYRAVPVQELREVWPLLQYGLDVVRQKNGEPWINEDVYASLLHSRSTLYVFEEIATGELVGFGIFEATFFPFEFKPRLNIWIGWSRRPGHGHLGVEVARKIAHAGGFSSIVFSTPQEGGWTKRFKKLHTWYEV